MIFILQVFVSVILFCPLLGLLLLFLLGRKMKLSSGRAFGYAADITTVILFFTVPLAIYSVWQVNVFIWLAIIAAIVAMIITYIDWRTKKEIEVPPLLRRIWRFYFISLVILYIVILSVGLVYSIIDYVEVV